MDPGRNVKVTDVRLLSIKMCCNESKYHLAAVRCKLYVEKSLLFSLFFKKDNLQCLHVNGSSYI